MKIFESKEGIYADISLLLVAIVWGSGFVVSKNSLNFITPLYLMAFRFSIASVLMVLVFWSRVKKIKFKEVIGGSIIGLFLFTAFAAQTLGLQYTTAGKQAFLTGTYVVIVPFIYWLVQHKKPDYYNLVSAILIFIGIGMLTLEGSFSIGIGDSLTLLCAILFAGHVVSIGYFAEEHDPIILTVIQFIVAAILSIISALIFEPFSLSITKDGLLGIGYLAVFSTLVAFLIQNIAQRYTTSTHAAIILSLEAVFGSILSVVFLGDIFNIRMFLGCIVIFIAIITAETKWQFLRN